jgi:hypothetical protein
MSHLRPAEVPYGAFYCAACCEVTACEPAVGHSALDPECPVECTICSSRIGEVSDVKGQWPMPDEVVTRQTLTPEKRAAGRALARKMALGVFDREFPADVPGPAAAPPPGYRERAAADIERLRGRR